MIRQILPRSQQLLEHGKMCQLTKDHLITAKDIAADSGDKSLPAIF
jgi:hypothetical protein